MNTHVVILSFFLLVAIYDLSVNLLCSLTDFDCFQVAKLPLVTKHIQVCMYVCMYRLQILVSMPAYVLRVSMCVYVCVCVRACVRACARAHLCYDT
jgi:hypothetical protein